MVRSVLEANPNSVQNERDRVDLDTMAGSKAGLKGSAVAPVEDLIEDREYIPSTTALDSIPNYGALKILPPTKSKTTHRGLGNLLLSGLCWMGIHQGNWVYLFKDECSQSRECGHCRAIDARTKHQQEWRYIKERSCGQKLTCMRCNASNGNKILHEKWSKPWQVSRSWWQSSKQGHRCLRCGVVEEWEDSTD